MNRKFIAGIALLLCTAVTLTAALPVRAESDRSLEEDREIIRHADNIENFHSGVAAFETRNHRTGFFTPEGKILTLLEGDADAYVVPIGSGNMIVYQNSKCGVMDRYGNIIIPVEWEDVLISGEENIWCVLRDHEYRLINSEAELFGPVSNTWIYFSEGMADITGEEGCGYITTDGEWAFTVSPEWTTLPFTDGKAEFYYRDENGNGVHGVMDPQGNVIRKITVDSSYTDVVYSSADDGYFAYREEEDGQLRLVRFDAVTGEITGVSHHVYTDVYGEEAPLYVLDTGYPAMTIDNELIPVMIFEASRDGFTYYQSFGYLRIPDLSLAIVPPSVPWSYAGAFLDGVADVQICQTDRVLGTLDYSQEGLLGLIDTDGNYIIPPSYEEIFFLTAGKIRVRTNGLFGIVDRDGQVLLEPEYTGIANLLGSEGDFIRVQKNGLWGILSTDDLTPVLDIKYDTIYSFDPETGLFIVQEEGLWGLVDLDGNKQW